jgi:hypothetical protein
MVVALVGALLVAIARLLLPSFVLASGIEEGFDVWIDPPSNSRHRRRLLSL